MKKSTIKEGFYTSMQRFKNIDSKNFGGCIRQIFDATNNNVLEWRIRESDKNLCIIQYYGEGTGYTIFEQEK